MAVGIKLEEARNRKGISIREVSESTKIRGDYLSAFEANNFDIDLPEVYLRGFVRLYARFLELDQDSILADLAIELGEPSGKPSRKSFGSITSTEVEENLDSVNQKSPTSPVNQKFLNSSLSKPIILASLTLFLVFLIIITLAYSFSGSDSTEEISTDSSSQVQEVTNASQLSAIESNNEASVQVHILKLISVGTIEKLIIIDGNNSTKEFKDLNKGWESEIKIAISFRCYCSNLENLRFAIDGKGKKVDGVGPRSFSWP
jgi:cytoskeletal protein RodZ